mmetsp:Transcript_2748/g.7645  ORF Transcript_2748/g.7645 Transcript_2748/m.7645 type:complete len:225 (-) Transcript_2748:33-707(-)
MAHFEDGTATDVEGVDCGRRLLWTGEPRPLRMVQDSRQPRGSSWRARSLRRDKDRQEQEATGQRRSWRRSFVRGTGIIALAVRAEACHDSCSCLSQCSLRGAGSQIRLDGGVPQRIEACEIQRYGCEARCQHCTGSHVWIGTLPRSPKRVDGGDADVRVWIAAWVAAHVLRQRFADADRRPHGRGLLHLCRHRKSRIGAGEGIIITRKIRVCRGEQLLLYQLII